MRPGITTMAGRVGERPDELEGLYDRPGPAMSDDEWQRVRLGRPHVHKVDPLPVNDGGELGQRVQPRLPDAPVIRIHPVVDQLT